MRDAVIVSAVRTPIGKKQGALAKTRADDLLAHVLRAAVARAGIEPGQIEDVIAGCVTQVGEQGFNIARVGNTSSASIPLAIHDAVIEGVIDRPMRLFAPGFGAGAVGGYAVLRLDPTIVAR